ncbi:conserved hypothetical protein [uncultured Pleomorphomonas sp.]|uniref:Uncharacterized protein n=1 Tax=uncultured Pleomorphomonas sp. TaxID=442121 RepID=A0A212L7X3_9HYPH|nr:DUF6384 family protein [uncultured Pleomorphomonas sp.]SCM73620.1 conserved hypothetical protein [uncultured Pleomorphomonas sp.]
MADIAQGGGTAAPKLDELMLAMDVVDTLRHQEGLVEKVLGEDNRDATLKERLRALYEGQGLKVSDRILDDGIRALKESRFTYDPAPPTFARTMALLWVGRAMVAKVVVAALLAIAVLGGVTWWRVASTERAAETARVEMAVTLPEAVDAAEQALATEALTTDARAEADRRVAAARTAIAAGDAGAARTAVAALADLRGKLAETYELRIVSRPGERTGVFRVPDVNTQARNYYLIVEAVTPSGDVLKMPVTSEEDGKVATVDKWGVRVPKATYDKVAADKSDDGIVEDNILGEKPRGGLEPVYEMDVLSGAITSW